MKLMLFLYIILNSFFAYSYDLEPNEHKNYLRFKNLFNSDAPNPPTLDIYENNKFSGKPLFSFVKEGLKLRGNLVCKWPDEYAKGLMYRDLHELKNKTACHQAPIFINVSNDGPTLLWIELEESTSNDYYEALFEGKPVYIDKKASPDFVFELSKKKKFELKRPEEQAAYEKLLIEDTDLKEYTAKMYDCFKDENKKCFPQNKADFQASYDWYINTICENSNPDVQKTYRKLAKYCADLKEPEEVNKPFNTDLREKDKIARTTFKQEFWNNFKSCFHDENPFKLNGAIFETRSAVVKSIILYPIKDDYLRCSISGKVQRDGKVIWNVHIK